MVKTLRLPLMIALCILLVTACSSSSEDASGDGRNGDGGSSKGEDEQITLRMTWWGDQPRHDYTLEVIELYQEQNPGVKIEAEYASWDDYWQSWRHKRRPMSYRTLFKWIFRTSPSMRKTINWQICHPTSVNRLMCRTWPTRLYPRVK